MTPYISFEEAEKSLGIPVLTARNWEKKGLIIPKQIENGIRYFEVLDLLHLKESFITNAHRERKVVVLTSPKTQFKAIELFSGAG